MNSKKIILGSWIVTAATVLLLTAANLILGDLNQDEGWYLYAARLVSRGSLPYRDFAYTQGPFLPLVYALFNKAVVLWGVAGGRIITAVFGLTGALLAARLASALSPTRSAGAALVTFILTAVNVYHSYFTTIVKTYSLTALCLAGGFLTLHYALQHKKQVYFGLAGILLSLAVCTRSSAVIAPLATLLLLWHNRNADFAPRAWLGFLSGCILAGVLFMLPFFLSAPENFWFNVVSYHTARATTSLLQTLVYKAGFVSRVLQAYFAVCVVLTLTLLRPFKTISPSPANTNKPKRLITIALWLTVIGVTALHFTAPFPYDDYQTIVYPLLCCAVAVFALDRFAGTKFTPLRLAVFCFLLAGAAAISSPLNQDWFIAGRDRIWWKVKDKPSLFKLQETARLIQSLCGPEDLLLTQDPYIAVEANRSLPAGLELGQFAYFPGLSNEQSAQRHVFNYSTMLDLLENTQAPVAALSGYAFALESPGIMPVPSGDREAFEKIIQSRYKLHKKIPEFGQAGTTLEIWTKSP